ncbi:MAG: glucuronate isomerase, partial [Desulfobacterales bacterium]|nr:glucuronate isomerase [Desulfobacterales bacterium]
MKNFLSEDFLLQSKTAKILYHEYAEDMPVYDYHCHLPVRDIAEDINFKTISHAWLYGDHYKWRAMRANGVDEHYITGKANDWEKFKAWSDTVPKTLCNPLYHWTHLELKRYFGINGKLLCPETAREIYETCNKMLQTQSFTTRALMKKMNVKVAFTTDDPTDSLESHRKIQMDSDFKIKILPAFRPDNAIAIEAPNVFNSWVARLEKTTDIPIKNYDSFLEALKNRHDFFHEMGCRLSDHGIEQPYADDFTVSDINRIFDETRQNRLSAPNDIRKFKSAVLLELARMDSDKNWVQQFHLGAIRNTNTKAWKLL